MSRPSRLGSRRKPSGAALKLPHGVILTGSKSSKGELLWRLHERAAGLPSGMAEYRFMDDRRFRFDFAWPEHRVALEIEGGTWSRLAKSRHTTSAGFEGDCEKYSLAAIAGWCLIRVTTKQLEAGLALRWVQQALAHRTIHRAMPCDSLIHRLRTGSPIAPGREQA